MFTPNIDLNHDLNHLKKKRLIFFLLPIFLIADLYEFNTNNCLQASRSTKFCMFFNTKAQSAHICVVVLSPNSLIVKYFMTLCMFELRACASCYQFSMLTQVRQSRLQLFNTVPVCSLVGDP